MGYEEKIRARLNLNRTTDQRQVQTSAAEKIRDSNPKYFVFDNGKARPIEAQEKNIIDENTIDDYRRVIRPIVDLNGGYLLVKEHKAMHSYEYLVVYEIINEDKINRYCLYFFQQLHEVMEFSKKYCSAKSSV